MSKKLLPLDRPNDSAELRAEGQHWRVSYAGPALILIVLVALAGVIYIASRAIDMSEKVVVPAAQLSTVKTEAEN